MATDHGVNCPKAYSAGDCTRCADCPPVTLADALPAIRRMCPDHLRLTDMGDILNVDPGLHNLTREDIDTVRIALAISGLREVESWIATQGATLFSDGLKSVSIRTGPAVDLETALADYEPGDTAWVGRALREMADGTRPCPPGLRLRRVGE